MNVLRTPLTALATTPKLSKQNGRHVGLDFYDLLIEVLYRRRLTVRCAGEGGRGGARPIQRFEGSRPWGGDYAYSIVLGLGRAARGTASGAGKSEARLGLVIVCVWWEGDFRSRLGTDSWFGGKPGAPRLRVVRGTE